MDKLMQAMELVAAQAMADFCRRGGVIRDGDRQITVEEAASFRGALTPIVWMLGEFAGDYGLDFPGLTFAGDKEAMVGVVVVELGVSRSASPTVFTLADFIRNELTPESILDLDLSILFANFKDWAAQNVPGYDGPERTGTQQPE